MKKKYIIIPLIIILIIIILLSLHQNNTSKKIIYHTKENIEINIQYPLYKYNKLNKKITSIINHYLKDNLDNYYFLSINYQDYEYKDYISIVLYISYFEGGAHPNYEIKTINYNKKNKTYITIDNLINKDKDLLIKLSTYTREYLSNNNMFKEEIIYNMMIQGTAPLKDNYKYLNLSNEGLIIYFPRYQIAPYYYGDYKITIPYNYLNLSI